MEGDSTFHVPGFTIPDAAYALLEQFCEQAGCDMEEALRIAVFHLLGSWEFDKQKREEISNDGEHAKTGDRSRIGRGHQPY
jgi:hypothetical protein